jgi:hypothetical protein
LRWERRDGRSQEGGVRTGSGPGTPHGEATGKKRKKNEDVDQIDGRRIEIQESHGAGKTEVRGEVEIERGKRGKTGSKFACVLEVDLEVCPGHQHEKDETRSHGGKSLKRVCGTHEEKVWKENPDVHDRNREGREEKGYRSLEGFNGMVDGTTNSSLRVPSLGEIGHLGIG